MTRIHRSPETVGAQVREGPKHDVTLESEGEQSSVGWGQLPEFHVPGRLQPATLEVTHVSCKTRGFPHLDCVSVTVCIVRAQEGTVDGRVKTGFRVLPLH